MQTTTPRQRYRCTPLDGSKSHTFTPPLPREHVHDNGEDCAYCEEVRGVHHGDTAVARRHTWSTKTVARGLEMLAGGSTYADVGRWALRSTGTHRTRNNEPANTEDPASATGDVLFPAAERGSDGGEDTAEGDTVEADQPDGTTPAKRVSVGSIESRRS
jgi:hypothetical protein